MKKFKWAMLALAFFTSSASAITINGTFSGAPNPNSGPGLDAIWSFTGVAPADSSVSFTFRGTGNADGNVATLDPFRLYGGTITVDDSTLIGTVGLDDPVDGSHPQNAQFLSDASMGIYTLLTRNITIPKDIFNSFITGGTVTFHLTNPAMQDPSNDWFWFSSSEQTLSYTPVPVPAAFPLFLSGLLVLARGVLRSKSNKPAQAVAQS